MGSFRDTHFVFQQSRNPQNKLLGVHEVCMELSGKIDVSTTVSLPTFYQDMEMVYILRGDEKMHDFGQFNG